MARRISLYLFLIAAAAAGLSLSCSRPAAPAGASEASDPGERGEAPGKDRIVRLTESQVHQSGIRLQTAGPGRLDATLNLPGEVEVNSDRMAHIVPRVPGVVREVFKNLGDLVRAGETMAVLDSRELADAKSAYLAARERVLLAQANYNREEMLWKKKISAEQEYLQAKNALAEARIEQEAAEQKLHSLGFSDDYLADMAQHPQAVLTRYEIAAPFDATIIDKHITLGEVIRDDTSVFLIADLRTVWIVLNVSQQDLPGIRKGQAVRVSGGPGTPEADGVISFISVTMGDQTRTTPVRVVLPNPGGLWRPGQFVTGTVSVSGREVPVTVPKDAVILVDGQPTLFVKGPDGFRPRPVAPGRTDGRQLEITSGLAPGEVYAAAGVFTLKAELDKPVAED